MITHGKCIATAKVSVGAHDLVSGIAGVDVDDRSREAGSVHRFCNENGCCWRGAVACNGSRGRVLGETRNSASCEGEQRFREHVGFGVS